MHPSTTAGQYLIADLASHIIGLFPRVFGSVFVAPIPPLSTCAARPTAPRWDGGVIPIVSGDHDLWIQHCQRGGLFGEYFDNSDLLGDPVIQRMDHIVNFTWGTGRITNFGVDFVSVRWTGKVGIDKHTRIQAPHKGKGRTCVFLQLTWSLRSCCIAGDAVLFRFCRH